MPEPHKSSMVVVKAFSPAEINFTPGERSAVSYITSDVVDNEGDVVVAAGVDYHSVFETNPVVMSCHDYQKWPVGLCDWIKVVKATPQRRFNGLIAKTTFDDAPDALRLFTLVQKGIVRGQSISFRPPEDLKPGEWGPPSKDELRARPEWETARRVIRRCVMLEYSFVPIPMNQESLVLAVSKGLELPTYLRSLVERAKAMSGVSGTNGGYDVAVDEMASTSSDDDQAPPHLKLKAGDYVEWGTGRKGGCGKILSIHKAGLVPGVDEQVEGTDDDPAARVRVYKALEAGGFAQTDKVMGHKCKALTRVEHELTETKSLLPPHRTLAQVESSLLSAIRTRFEPVSIAHRAAQDVLDRARGVV